MWYNEVHFGQYYYIVHVKSSKVLGIESIQKKHKKLILQPKDSHNLGQIWLFEFVAPYKYKIIHAESMLLLQYAGNQLHLHLKKQNKSQLFFLERCGEQPEEFRIKSNSEQSQLYVCLEQGKLKIMEKNADWVNDQQLKWTLHLVKDCPPLYETCYIEFLRSGQVADVPESSDKPGLKLCQFPLNHGFSQRWQIIPNEKQYLIRNLKTKLYLQIKGAEKKQQTPIIQSVYNGNPNQKWTIQEQGKRTYLIRSVLSETLLLGVEGCTLKEAATLVALKDQTEAFCRIIGPFTPN